MTQGSSVARTGTLDLGWAVSTSFKIFFANFVPFLSLGLVVFLPFTLTQWWVATATEPNMTPGKALLISLVPLFVQTILQFLMAGAVSHGTYRQLRKEPASIGDSISVGFRCLGSVIATGLLVGARVVLFTLLLIVPGIMEMCKLYVAMPATVMEKIGAGDACARSATLTSGQRWTIFGIVFILGVIGGLISWVVTSYSLEVSLWANLLVTWITTAVFSGVGAVAASVVYFQLRRSKEGADLQSLAAIFD